MFQNQEVTYSLSEQVTVSLNELSSDSVWPAKNRKQGFMSRRCVIELGWIDLVDTKEEYFHVIGRVSAPDLQLDARHGHQVKQDHQRPRMEPL